MAGANAREPYLLLIEGQSRINDRYAEIQRLGADGGKGNFSMVFSSNDKVTEQRVALKFFDPLQVGDQYRVDCFKREAQLLESFKGQPDINELVEGLTTLNLTIKTGNTELPLAPLMYHVTELADSDLEVFIHTGDGSVRERLDHFRACCRAVQRLHSANVVHRDLNPGNFLILKHQVRLGDFGTARNFSSGSPLLDRYRQEAPFRGHRFYTAPELLLGEETRPNAFILGDFYSLGAILFELFSKSILGQDILDIKLLSTLQDEARLVTDDDLPEWTRNKVQDLATRQPLPNLGSVVSGLPRGLSVRLNRLYQGLASLDYTKRTMDFNRVFRVLDSCDRLLQRQEAVRRLENQRRSWRRMGRLDDQSKETTDDQPR